MNRTEAQNQQIMFRKIRDGFHGQPTWHDLPTPLSIRAFRATVRASWLGGSVLRQTAEKSFALAATDTSAGRYAAYYDDPIRRRLLDEHAQTLPEAEDRLRLVVAQLKFRGSYHANINRIWATWAAEKDIAQNVDLQTTTEMIGEVYGRILGVTPPDEITPQTTE